MMEHNTVFLMDLLDRALTDVKVDGIRINEDMAYKHAAMISPQMIEKFLVPRYRRLVAFLKSKSIPVLMVDSDGYIGELLPVWEKVGFNATYPIEIAAANDPVEYREKYGDRIAFMGGIDKRKIRSRQETYDEVMSKVPHLVETGGYLPAVDHAVPPDIPLRSFIYMGELIKAIAEGREILGPDASIELEEKLLHPDS
jgi:uroporphyrinogen decarboxylase